MHTSYSILKNTLKKKALGLRKLKNKIRSIQRESGTGNAWREQAEVLSLKANYRHTHIAYCLLRGRKYEEIENHCRKGNEPNWKTIQEIKDAYTAENVCAGEA